MPQEAAELIRGFITFKKQFDRDAQSKAVPRTSPGENFNSAFADCYPNLPVHTMDDDYEADKNKDNHETRSCNKNYPESPTITGGIAHITCEHGVLKGKP